MNLGFKFAWTKFHKVSQTNLKHTAIGLKEFNKARPKNEKYHNASVHSQSVLLFSRSRNCFAASSIAAFNVVSCVAAQIAISL